MKDNFKASDASELEHEIERYAINQDNLFTVRVKRKLENEYRTEKGELVYSDTPFPILENPREVADLENIVEENYLLLLDFDKEDQKEGRLLFLSTYSLSQEVLQPLYFNNESLNLLSIQDAELGRWERSGNGSTLKLLIHRKGGDIRLKGFADDKAIHITEAGHPKFNHSARFSDESQYVNVANILNVDSTDGLTYLKTPGRQIIHPDGSHISWYYKLKTKRNLLQLAINKAKAESNFTELWLSHPKEDKSRCIYFFDPATKNLMKFDEEL